MLVPALKNVAGFLGIGFRRQTGIDFTGCCLRSLAPVSLEAGSDLTGELPCPSSIMTWVTAESTAAVHERQSGL